MIRDFIRRHGRRRALLVAMVPVTAALAWMGFHFAGSPSHAPALILRLSPADAEPDQGGATARSILVAVDLRATDSRPRILLDDFSAIGTPRVSFDGRRVVLAARRSEGDPMEVWEISASGGRPTRITQGGECADPAFLADGRIVYSRTVSGHGPEAVTALFTTGGDGSAERRITFGEARDSGPAVLPDGRIVFRRRPASAPASGRLFVVSPDGTGLHLLVEPEEGASIEAGPWPLDDVLVFAEESNAARRLVSVTTRDPRGLRRVLAADPPDGVYASVSLLPVAGLLAAVGPGGREWRLTGAAPEESPRLTEIEAALRRLPDPHASLRPSGAETLAPRARPLILTSVVDETKATGTLLCLNAYASQDPAIREVEPGGIRSVWVTGSDGSPLGTAPVQPDGSFFIEVPADRPLLLELHGPAGVLSRNRSPFWVRPNENRACTGCHADPELAPENRVVMALADGPTRLTGSRPPPAGLTTDGEAAAGRSPAKTPNGPSSYGREKP